MSLDLNNVTQAEYDDVINEVYQEFGPMHKPYWEESIENLQSLLNQFQNDRLKIDSFNDPVRAKFYDDYIDQLLCCIREKAEARIILGDYDSISTESTATDKLSENEFIENDPALISDLKDFNSQPNNYINQDNKSQSQSFKQPKRYSLKKHHYVKVYLNLLPEISNKKELEEFKAYCIMTSPQCKIYPDYRIIRGLLMGAYEQQTGRSTQRTRFFEYWELNYKDEIPKNIAYGELNPEHRYFVDHQNKMMKWLGDHGLIGKAQRYYTALLATKQQIDIYSVFDKYAAMDRGTTYGFIKLPNFKLPLLEFKALASIRSILGDQLFINSEGYKFTTIKAVMGRMVGCVSKDEYERRHPRGHPLERNHCGRVTTLIKNLEKKKLIKKHYFRDLDHRHIYLTINLDSEILKEKIIMNRENKKQQQEQERKKKLFDQWAFKVKDFSHDQQLNFTIRGLDRDDLLKFLLQNDIRREEEMSKMKDSILKMQNFFELMINGDRYIDTKQRSPKELREALNNVNDYFN